MILKKVQIKNYRSIKDSGYINFDDSLFVLAGQNESGKSSILEALKAYEDEEFDRDTLNFEEEQNDNVIQSVSCIYQIKNNEEFARYIIEEIKSEFKIKQDEYINIDKIKGIKEFTITKEFDHNEDVISMSINDGILGLLKGAIHKIETVSKDENGNETKKQEPIINIDENQEKIANVFWRITPQIVLFSDFSDLLPDKILIEDLEKKNKKAKGYEAVLKLETIMNTKKFINIAKSSNAHKRATTAKSIEAVSVTFQKDWQQKIYGNNKVEISFNIENDDTGKKTIYFYIETQDNVPLEPRKRSKGMIWFLSAWLELKSKENSDKLIILYDEPGLFLHIKAQKDMLNLFKYLTTEKNYQIIYSTHSPSLIDVDKLYNIGLVLNTERQGTLVESLTTSKINTEYKKDALQPIAEAMGLDTDVGILSDKNILLEGLSDFYYFQAMKQLLNQKNEYKFVPGIGIKNGKIYHLISFCLGYGLDWLLVMDDGENSKIIKNELETNLFSKNKEDLEKKVYILEKINGIENMFSCKDLQLIDEKIKCNEGDDKVKKIGNGRKILFAKKFLQMVNNESIKQKDIDKKTIEQWKKVFDYINIQFK